VFSEVDQAFIGDSSPTVRVVKLESLSQCRSNPYGVVWKKGVQEMADEDSFYTALGPADPDSGFPRGVTGFSTSASSLDYGVNAQGLKCGVYAESVREELDREAQEGTGVYSIGETFGIMANGNRGIVGTYSVSNEGGKGVIGVTGQIGTTDPEQRGIGVVGADMGFSTPSPLLWGETMPSPSTIRGGPGTGVHGLSGTGTGVFGESNNGRGGVFRSESSAQVQLEPRDVPINTPRTDAVRLSAWQVGEGMAPAQLPADGRAGDLLATTHPLPDAPENIVGTLWFCSRGSTDEHAAVWREVLMGPEFTDEGLVVGLKLLDDFTTGFDSFCVPPGTITTRYQEGAMAGGVRRTILENVPVPPPGTDTCLNVGSADRLNLELGANTAARLYLTYGMGPDGLHPLGINLHEGGARSIRVTIAPLAGTSIPPGSISFNVQIFTPAGYSELGYNVGAGQIDFEFDKFISGGAGQDFRDVYYINFLFQTIASFRLERIETVP
jgi:hypothetical protein